MGEGDSSIYLKDDGLKLGNLLLANAG